MERGEALTGRNHRGQPVPPCTHRPLARDSAPGDHALAASTWRPRPTRLQEASGYRAIADEIREARTQETEGIAVNTFRYTLPTSILQQDGSLSPLPPE